jgi:uncharacterized protein (TIGR02145 family)
MKKTLLIFAAMSCVLTVGAETAVVPECNTNTPGWGNNLGTVRFKTSEIWKIGDQEWSDVVTATNCQKETFDGGTNNPANFNADCRKNITGFGDLFSWCAVVRFARHLCPAPWRVPTVRDFIQLDEALGGEGERRRNDSKTLVEYNIWGGGFGGFCDADGTLNDQGFGAFYWAISENRAGRGSRLNFFTNGYISPQGWDSKALGHMVRCVR